MATHDHATAYTAAAQVAAANGVRGLMALEADDPEVGLITIEVHRDGSLTVTLTNLSGAPIGAYTL